ncbi:MAG: sigma-54-dependent Fis family transcriptional regulator [Calditrichaeota bacterium]|nr:sigma-54-dependent Fis family transcriptional regulator [Calditrichota bacterium]
MGTERILVVDDEESMREFLNVVLSKEGYSVYAVGSGKEALEALAQDNFALLISDLRMPEMSGLELVALARKRHPQLAVIVITAFASLESAIEALRLGASDYIMKPFQVDEILLVVAKACEQLDLRRENQSLREQLRHRADRLQIIAESPRMKKILEVVKRIGPSDATILITGESGTGKELIAQALHAYSLRSEAPFVTINCGALPDTLLESELFGHTRGSFTGAVRDKEGLFKVASRGTLFLDEIAEMSPALQVKLLRALQEREILPIGATKPVKADVRVIAATNADIEKKQKSGEFRSDLYYRLAVIPIHLIPLREREEDIPALVTFFLERTCKRNGLALKRISPEAMKLLLAYPWPGNVRELENTIERAVILTESDMVMPESLPGKIHASESSSFRWQPAQPSMTLEEVERDYLVQVLHETGWQKRRASEILGIDPSTIYRKLQRYGIEPPDRN